ncbi:MAG: hypothetical protein ABII12_15175 [Planctomycetota bacterium]
MQTSTVESPELTIDWKPVGDKGLAQLTVKLNGNVIDADKIDISRESVRGRYVKRLSSRYPGIDRDNLEAELLTIAGQVSEVKTPAANPDGGSDLDVSAIARCELFHSEHVSGILIPTASILGGKPVGRWRLYLRWHGDGKRESRDLSDAIDLSNGGRLWLYPKPADPTPTMRAGWTAKARRSWLDGANVPNLADVFKHLCERFAYFLDFTGETASGDVATLALWSMFSYIYPCWSAVPYLNVGGPLASGKSRVFELLSRIVFRPLQSSNMTAACLFRTLHESGSVLLLDEAEALRDKSDDANAIRSVLLSGYKLGSPARRLEKVGDGFQQVAFNVFGPKAIAGIARLPDALASRCIRITMFRASRNSAKPKRRIDEDPAVWADIRDDLHALALEHGLTWRQLASRTDVCRSMAGRDFELWQPLLALAAFVQENGAVGLVDIVRDYAGTAIESNQDDSTPDADELLLRLLADSVAVRTQAQVTPSGLLSWARERESGLFERWTPRGVSAALKRYKVLAVKTGGRRVYRDVTTPQLVRIQEAYGLDLGLGTDPTDPTDPEFCPETVESAIQEGR